jgi:phosphate transport system substrate-binding protein
MKKSLIIYVSLILILTGCAGTEITEPTASPTQALTQTQTPAPAPPPTQSPNPPPTPTPIPYVPLTLTEDEFPLMDGSTANIPLGEAVAAVLMGKPRGDCARFAEFTGTDSAYRRLFNRDVDLLIVYEAARETRQAGFLGSINRAAIGSDALVFLVNARNPVDSLTVEEIRGIYMGEITNWNEVGGEDAEIMPFQRNETAGSQALMQSLVMGDRTMMTPPQHLLFMSMGAAVAGVSAFDTGRYAIGYNVFFYVTEMLNDPNVKIIAVNGVIPSKETISSGEYRLTNDFYAVIRNSEPEDSPAYKVWEWLQGAEGQMLVDLEGYAAKGK